AKTIVPPSVTGPKTVVTGPCPFHWMPCNRPFGTGFPPKLWYPSKVHRYKPFSMPTLQTRAGAGPAVADVLGPSAIAAAKHTNAQAKASELTIIFVNFVFIVVVSFCLSFLVLAFFDSSLLRSHFRPF